MSHRTIDQTTLMHDMTTRMTILMQQVSAWVIEESPTLETMEKTVLQHIRALGNALVAGLCALRAPRYAESSRPCPHCGETTTYQRRRTVHVTTLLGDISYERPYYTCSSCHQGHAPLDESLHVCPGGISDGLDELCAFAGIREAFADACEIIQKLSLVTVCPNTIRAATEGVGHAILQHDQQKVTDAFDPADPVLPPPPTVVPDRLYVSMDGNMVNIRNEGWKENKLGAVYTTTTTVSQKHPDTLEIHAHNISYMTDFVDSQTFGSKVWLEAYRRGVTQAREVVVIGDGAPWIWNLAAEHYPTATQILDWYHGTEYLWDAANAIYGTGTALAKGWVKERLDELWDGKTDTVLAKLARHTTRGEAVQDAITYYTNNRERMHYPQYRAKGMQVGSGTIESGCKHVVAHRLKQAGMIWNMEDARAMAKARAWMKSGRWDEAMALRPRRRRSYERKHQDEEVIEGQKTNRLAEAA